jgi:hypothetical protein
VTSCARLVLLADNLRVALPVRIEEFFASLLPRPFELGGCDVPVRPSFPKNGAWILAEIFDCRPAEEPVTHVNLVDYETRLEHERVRDHGIVGGISVFGDLEILLHNAARIGKERPMCTDSAAKFVSLSDVIGTNRD